ncbi:MAG: hypothetical protein E7599_02405 [Ruminococcaceae bacterium]|nr:hypothetical protein [Oscillospiraceae bacterium]
MKKMIVLTSLLMIIFLFSCGGRNGEKNGALATPPEVDGSENLIVGSQTENLEDDTALENDINSPEEPVSVPLEWFFPFLHDHPNVEECDGKECLKIEIVRDTETVQTYLDMMKERTAEAFGTFKVFLDREWREDGILAQQLEHYKRSVIALGHCDEAYFENYDLILIHTCNPNFGYDKADMTCQVIEGEGKKQLQVDIVYKELGFPDLRMPVIIALCVDKSLGIESTDDIILVTKIDY